MMYKVRLSREKYLMVLYCCSERIPSREFRAENISLYTAENISLYTVKTKQKRTYQMIFLLILNQQQHQYLVEQHDNFLQQYKKTYLLL